MAELIAQGQQSHQRWRRTLKPGRKIIIGRTSGSWETPWDEHISRQHVEVCLNKNQLEVTRIPEAGNPVFYHGRKLDQFLMRIDEHFVIGNTSFTLTDQHVNLSQQMPHPVTEQTFSAEYLKGVKFRDADQRIDVLGQIPEIISGAANDNELCMRMVNILLSGIPRATTVAVVAIDAQEQEEQSIKTLHWDHCPALQGKDFHPSERLIVQATQSDESVLHVWSAAAERGRETFTISEGIDWAFCIPLSGESCRGWAIYVAGQFSGPMDIPGQLSDPHDLRDDVKFAELASSTLSSLRELRMLERNHTSLSQFFSPVVLEALEGRDPNVILAPRETEVTVLFCDLRGFSRESERSAGDLLGLLERVSRALGVTTQNILEQGGVVGDFHGDSAMGFWGWPLPQEDSAVRCCLAALAIRTEFEKAAQRNEHPLTDFHIGIGVATGRAVAGKIGTVDQVKVTVFGPVVNLASRIEGMTRILRAPILLDQKTAEIIRSSMTSDQARVRRVAYVRPYGMETSLEVSELLPGELDTPHLTSSHLMIYETALDALLQGDWDQAFELLHRVPAEDRVKDFLTVYIAQHNRTPPQDWDGVIPLKSK